VTKNRNERHYRSVNLWIILTENIMSANPWLCRESRNYWTTRNFYTV